MAAQEGTKGLSDMVPSSFCAFLYFVFVSCTAVSCVSDCRYFIAAQEGTKG